jgi:hypothetical protein
MNAAAMIGREKTIRACEQDELTTTVIRLRVDLSPARGLAAFA